MQNENNKGAGLEPLLYRLRRVSVLLITVLLSLASLYFGSYFTASDTATSAAILRGQAGTDKDEIVFASAPMQEEYFIILNGEDNLRLGERRVSCDLLMLPTAAHSYENNYIGMKGTLAEGECLLSKNLLTSYSLSVGDTLTVRSTGASVTVVGTLPAIPGFDDVYLHEGVAVIGYSEAVAAEAERKYVSFVRDGDGYVGLDRIVSVTKLGSTARRSLAAALAILFAVGVISALVWELLISRRFCYGDLALLSLLGTRPRSLYFKTFGHLLLRYFLPAACVCIGFYIFGYSAWEISYLLPTAVYLIAYALFLALLTFIIYKRVAICQMKRK